MRLRLKDLVFDVSTAELSGRIPDPYWHLKYNTGGDRRLFWLLHIKTEQRMIDGQRWCPGVYHESLYLPVRNWTDVGGQVIQWDEPFDDDTGELNGGFYVFEHGDIPRGRLHFGRRYGNRFSVFWEGTCNVHWNSQLWEDVPFSINAEATFSEIVVAGSSNDDDATMLDRLSLYLQPTDLEQLPIKYEKHAYVDGVGMATTRFRPKIRRAQQDR